MGLWVVSFRCNTISRFECCRIIFFFQKLLRVKVPGFVGVVIGRLRRWYLYKTDLDWGEGKIGWVEFLHGSVQAEYS